MHVSMCIQQLFSAHTQACHLSVLHWSSQANMKHIQSTALTIILMDSVSYIFLDITGLEASLIAQAQFRKYYAQVAVL